MKRLLTAASVVAILVFGADDAAAKPKPKPQGNTFTITEKDVHTCLGVNRSAPKEQVEACTKIILTGKVKHPHIGDYYATRAGAFFAMSMLDPALEDLNKALTIRKAPEFYFQRALVQLSRQDQDAAKRDLAEVMKLKPDFAPVYLIRGVVAYNESQFNEAVEFFDEAVKRVPTYYQALFARGVAKKKAGDESGGDKDIKEARGMSPKVDEDLKGFGLTAS